MSQRQYPSLFDLPIANLVQIFSHLPVKDLLQVETSSKFISSVVHHCLSDCRSVEVTDESGALVEPLLLWAKKQKKLDNVRSFCASGQVCAAAIDSCLTDRNAAELWPKLTHLKLEQCRLLKDTHVELITQQWPQLTTLDLAGCVNISDMSLYTIADSMPQLKHLNCSNWLYVSDDALVYLAKKLTGLKTLVLDGCTRITSRSISALAQHCPELQAISAAGCFRLCNTAVTAWSEHQALMSAGFRQCPKLSSISSLSSCSSLATLDISGCPLVSDLELYSLLAKAGKQVQHLNVAGCAGLTSSTIAYMASFCPNLTHLNISRMDVADEHLRNLSVGCRGLQHFNVDWCSKITDPGLVALAECSALLSSLSIEGMCNVTDQLLDRLATSCPQLRRLNVRLCPQLSAAGLMRIASTSKLLSICQ